MKSFNLKVTEASLNKTIKDARTLRAEMNRLDHEFDRVQNRLDTIYCYKDGERKYRTEIKRLEKYLDHVEKALSIISF